MLSKQRALVVAAVFMLIVTPFVFQLFNKYPVSSHWGGSGSGSGTSDGSDGVVPKANRKTAPDFKMNIVGSGQSVHLHEPKRKRPMLFSFWATWCGPCQQELPHLEAFYKKYGDKIDFYGINSDDDEPHIKSFVAKNNLTFPMLADSDRTAATSYDVSSIPQTFIVDGSGNIVYAGSGFDPDIEADLPPILEKVAAGTL